MNKFVKAIVLVVCIMAFGVLIGWMWGRGNAAGKTVTNQIILNALRERGFLVTETIVSTVATTIKTDETNIWKKIIILKKRLSLTKIQ